MARRQLGHGRGGRMKIEKDPPASPRGCVTAHARRAGGAAGRESRLRQLGRADAPWPVEAEVAEVHLPRPGHADLVGTQKYKQTDVRNILERASARETAARVAGGALCKAFLAALGVQVRSHVVQIASVHAPERERPLDARGLRRGGRLARALPGRGGGRAMVAEINKLRKANESLGGVFEVQAFGLVPGLGSHISWEERLDGRLAMAICSIQAMKGVAIGDGFRIAGVPGSQAHDEIFYSPERGYYRETNRSGGLEGGMTTGEPLIVRGAMKPLPTLTKPLRSVDIATHEPAEALRERTDSCTVPAAGVVGEAMVALVLADAYRRKFGGDHIDDVRQAVRRLLRADRVAGSLSCTAPRADARERAPGGASERVRLPSRRALVFIGFMGAGKSTVAAEVAAALGVQGARQRPSARAGARALDRGGVRRGAARRPSGPPRRSSSAGCSAQARARIGDRAGRRQRALAERVREALEPHLTVLLDVGAEVAWRRVGGGSRPARSDRWRPIGRRSSRCTRAARSALRAAGGRDPAGARSAVGLRALPALAAVAKRRPGRACCGRAPPPATTRCWSDGACCTPEVCSREALWPLDRDALAPVLRLRPDRRPLYAERLGGVAGADRDLAGRAPQDACERRAGVERAGRRAA